MKKYLFLVLIVMASAGCVQVATLTDGLKALEACSAETQEKSEELIKAADTALVKIADLITEAEKGVAPKIAEGDIIVDISKKAASAAAPFLPFPFNVVVGLVPFGVAWFRARSRADKRTAEEGLLVVALQSLKKEDPEAFKKFVTYRDMAAKGLMTAKKTSELLAGINSIRAKFAS